MVGRYGRGRTTRSIRSGIVGIQSRRSVCSDATKPDRISGSTTLSRKLIRDHRQRSTLRIRSAFVGECVPKARPKSLRRQKSAERTKTGSSPKGRPSNFRKNARVAGIWLACDDASLLPCIRVPGSRDTSGDTYKYLLSFFPPSVSSHRNPSDI